MERYVKLVPDDELGHNFLGYLFFKTKNYHKAKHEFEKALEINPHSTYAKIKLSDVRKAE